MNADGVRKILDFQLRSNNISETIQETHLITTEHRYENNQGHDIFQRQITRKLYKTELYTYDGRPIGIVYDLLGGLFSMILNDR